jgi:hypothetical protein
MFEARSGLRRRRLEGRNLGRSFHIHYTKNARGAYQIFRTPPLPEVDRSQRLQILPGKKAKDCLVNCLTGAPAFPAPQFFLFTGTFT